jgi:hypothetical protein
MPVPQVISFHPIYRPKFYTRLSLYPYVLYVTRIIPVDLLTVLIFCVKQEL